MTVKSPVASNPPGSHASRTHTKSKAKKASQQHTKENLDYLSAIEISQAAEELRVANKMFGETPAPQAVEVIKREIVQDDGDPLVEPTASNTIATEDTVPTDVSVPVQVIEPEIVLDDEDPLVEQTTSDTNATENTVLTEVSVPVQVIEPEIIQDIEDPLVVEAFEYLKNSFRLHFHEAMLAAGRYLVDKFYDKDYDWARQGKKPKKKGSLNKLIERLQANSGDAPSKPRSAPRGGPPPPPGPARRP